MEMKDPSASEGGNPISRKDLWLLLLLVPFVLLLYPPLYAHASPLWEGIPFFIWYQFLLVLVGAAITGLVYRARG